MLPGYWALPPWISGIRAADQTSVSPSFLQLSKSYSSFKTSLIFNSVINTGFLFLLELEKYLSSLISLPTNCCPHSFNVGDGAKSTLKTVALVQGQPLPCSSGQLSPLTLGSLTMVMDICSRMSGLEGGMRTRYKCLFRHLERIEASDKGSRSYYLHTFHSLDCKLRDYVSFPIT